MSPVELSVRRPYTVAVCVLLAMVASWLAFRAIPVQLKPTVEEPRINVATSYRGASASEVEEEVTRELEEVLQGVEGLLEMVSSSTDGSSTITLEFDYGTDAQLAVVDVINKLSQVPSLPAEADEPAVSIASASDEDKMMWIATASAYEPDQVVEILEREVRARLERIEGVSDLLLVGGSEREIQVRLDLMEMDARGIRLEQVLDALRAGNQNLRGGTVETRTRQLAVRTVGRAELAADLEQLIVASSPAGDVRLGDLARVVDDFRESSSFMNLNGVPSCAIGVGRQTGANVVETSERVEAELERINAGFRSRGIDLHLTPVYRETTYIDAALDFVTDNLVLGAVLALSALLIFLRSFRSILVVGLAIPISLAAVFPVLVATDRTLNVIALAGLAFSSGMVVDNAIVVLENIYRHLEIGKSRVRAAIDGGREVWGGVFAATLTTVAVFVPILLNDDEASQIFSDMAIAISAAVILSLVVSLTLVPVLCSMILRAEGSATAGGKPPLGLLGRAYGGLMDRLVHNRLGGWSAKLGVILLVGAACAVTYPLAPPAEYLPAGNRNLVFFFAEPIPGTRVEAVKENFQPWERFLLAQPETERLFVVGAQGFNGGGVILKPEYSDAASLAAFHQRLFGPNFIQAGFEYLVPIRASLFRDSGKQFEVEISGPDINLLAQASDEFGELIRGVEGAMNPQPNLVMGRPQLVVRVDEERAKELGLDVSSVGGFVEVAIAGRRVTRLIEGGREVEVNVLAPQAAVAGPDDLAELRLRTPDGRSVPLGAIADVSLDTGPQTIRRLERERSALVTVNIAPDAPLESVLEDVEEQVFPVLQGSLGPDYSLSVGGAADKLRLALDSLTSGFGLSVLIIYLLLVALFRSWFAPGVILVTVPLALTGGLFGILLAMKPEGSQAAFDVLSMLGFVLLAGLVVNNAILILHQANNLRDEGVERRQALADAAKSRLRPIVISVLTTVLGMLPLALGGGAGAELYQGLAAILVGGLAVSTLFTLFVVPVLASLGHDIADAVGRRAPAELGRPSPIAT